MFSEAVIVVDHVEAPKYGVLRISRVFKNILPALALETM
jgi:hypothetical protein